MATTATKYCGTAVDNADGFDAWSNTSNAQGATDAVYATSGGSSGDAAGGVGNYIKCTNFGFTSSDVPAGATINGITVTVVAHGTRTSANFGHIFLVKGGTIMTATTDKGGSGQPGSTTDVTFSVGGAADLWGNTLTQSDVTSSNFGVALAGSFALAATLSLDSVGIQITYTAAAGGARRRCSIICG